MTKRMLIDATHAEETRVVVLDGNRLEDFDVETSTKKQLKGNIYLAKVVRVEPSLQAAFVEYGGGRHGFLAFGEIHPDYYQIPVADRQRLLELQAEEAREEEEAEEAAERARETQGRNGHSAADRRDHDDRDRGDAGRAGAEALHAGHDDGDDERPRQHHDDGAESDDGADSEDGGVEAAGGADADREDVTTIEATEVSAGSDEQGSFYGDAGSGAVEPQSLAPFPSFEEPSHEPAVTLHGGGHLTGAPSPDAVSPAGHVPSAHSANVEAPGAPHSPPADASHEAHAETPGETPDGDAPQTPRPAQPASIIQDVRFGEVEVGAGEQGPHIGGGAHDERLTDRGSAADASAGEATTHVATEEVWSPDAHGAESNGDAGDAATAEVDHDIETPDADSPPSDLPPPETIGGETDTYDGAAEARARRASRLLRNYRIQEVIRRRQIMLVQVVKEERGTKGAALTTYISLAGRYCVLMPNSPRGGGISRKITSASDRRRLKEITSELEIPRGMGLIVRTAGANRPKPEIRRDCEYLMRLWDDIREHTLNSVAPALIYEEASLIKRAIRDVYSRDVEDVLVDGEQGWRAAHDFMRMLMPAHARKVQLWRPEANGGGGQPLFSKHGVEAQLDAMLSPTVQLRSGGYLVIAQTEALVSIDVNSGRSTRERGIEETALKTNLEAADEVARQLRLRDLAGLIVIDFIDMESKKNNAMVERRMKEALKNDRARIQVGHISHFGLLEMSRQRLRPSLAETSFVTCPHCGGLGHVRSVESSAIHVLRAIEEEGAKRRASLIMVYCASSVSLYLLNNKRDRLGEIEERYAMRVHFTPDDLLVPPNIRIDRLRPQVPDAERPSLGPVVPVAPAMDVEGDDEDIEDDDDSVDEVEAANDAPGAEAAQSGGQAGAQTGTPTAAQTGEEAERRRRRRRRRGGRRDQGPQANGAGEPGAAPSADASGLVPPGELSDEDLPFGDDDEPAAPAESRVAGPDAEQPLVDPADFDENGLPRARGPRRSRRGGRRRRRDGLPGAPGDVAAQAAPAEAEEPPPVYEGPTPANPFARPVFDIFELMDQAEEARNAPPPAAAPVPSPLDIPPIPPNATAPIVETPETAQHAAVTGQPGMEPPVVEQPVAERAAHEPAVALGHAEPAEPVAQVPEAASAPPVEPAAPAEVAPLAAVAVQPEPEPAPAAPEPPPEPLIKPIVIGADAPATERKQGWWRR